MAEYINKKDLIDFIKDTRQRLPHDSKDFFTRDNMLLNFEQIVSQMHTADVVEVVRCKDCEYFRLNDENVPYCLNSFGLNDHEPNGFCNYGIWKN